VDPFEPPLPGKVTADQAIHFAESLARGEPNRKRSALTALSDKVRELVKATGASGIRRWMASGEVSQGVGTGRRFRTSSRRLCDARSQIEFRQLHVGGSGDLDISRRTHHDRHVVSGALDQ
jgi:hypothetical protein